MTTPETSRKIAPGKESAPVGAVGAEGLWPHARAVSSGGACSGCGRTLGPNDGRHALTLAPADRRLHCNECYRQYGTYGVAS